MIMSALIGISFAPALLDYYKFCVYLTEFDVLNGPFFIALLFTFIETEPFQDHFDVLGVGDMNFFSNVGSLPVICVLIVINHIFWRILFFCGKTFYCSKMCRRLGMRSESYKSLSNPLTKLGMDGYLDICMGSTLGMLMIGASPNQQTF